MRNFFIVGLPRSRTAWLANLLTYGDSFCFHDALSHVPSPQHLPALFMSGGRPVIGDADPSVPLFHGEIAELFPEAQYVFVDRPYEDALASYSKFVLGNPCRRGVVHTPAEAEEGFAALALRLRDMKHALAGRHTLTVQFSSLDEFPVVEMLHYYCTGAEINYRRWEMLRNFRVNVIPHGLEKSLDLENVEKLAHHRADASVRSSLPTGLHLAYSKRVAAMCGTNQAACRWLEELLEVWLTWDHIEDNDVIDKAMANRVFENLLLAWTVNPFWQQYKELLTPVLANAISAWRSGGEKEYDVYTEVPCAVAYLLGGQALVAAHLPGIRDLIRSIRADDDATDK